MKQPLVNLVGHRGFPQEFPENTLEGVRGALDAGARFVEFDVQLSGDRQAIVYHDASLERTSGIPGSVFDISAVELTTTPAGEPARFGTRFAEVCVPTLARMVELLVEHPECTAFVEVKEESIERFGASAVLGETLTVIRPIRDRAVLISFDRRILPECRNRGFRIGWVLRAYDDSTCNELTKLAPEFVFSNVKRLPDAPGRPWPGPWEWVVYDVVDPEAARSWPTRGVRFVETWSIGQLLAAIEAPMRDDESSRKGSR